MWSFCLWCQPSYRGSVSGPALVTGSLCTSSASQRSSNVPEPRAGNHLTPQTETLTSQCLPWGFPLPLLPQCYLFPVSSCITIPIFFPVPVQLSCPTYWIHWVYLSLHISLSQSNPSVAKVMKSTLLCLKHVVFFFFFYLLQKRSWLK